MSGGIRILYEDHHLVAVNKPARIPVASEDSGDETLLDQVRRWNQGRQAEGKKGYCVPIHFLDRPVSGTIIFALSSKAASRLNDLFRNRQMNKTYLAVTSRKPEKESGTLEHWLSKSHDDNTAIVSTDRDRSAKKCILSYRVLKSIGGKSLIEVKPITGRSHQIRAQMAAIGAPLVGDVKYGADNGWGGRVALHAVRLSFKHPVGGREMNITAPLPEYWAEIWNDDLIEAVQMTTGDSR
jgi:23S rRNA pseudouridine1911/1915/1917 synthase